MIFEADEFINHFGQRKLVSSPEYDQEIRSRELKCGTVYDEERLNGYIKRVYRRVYPTKYSKIMG